ncbi:MAG TPA: YceI family protein, partial [Myxococcaceae bacterium]
MMNALPLLAALAAAAPQTYEVAPGAHGKVRFNVEGPLDDVPGETRELGGHLELDPQDWVSGKARVVVSLETLHTGIDQRDADMREQFLQTERYPRALLSIDRLERPSTAALTPGNSVQGDASGSFELHGVRRSVRIPVKLTMEQDGRIWVAGSFEVPFADYNIQRPSRLFLKLGESADVTFDILFAQVPGAAPKPAPPLAFNPTVTELFPASPKSKPRPLRKPKPFIPVTFVFGKEANTPRSRGEAIFHNATTGGSGNKLTCYHCHARTDERLGLKQGDGFARAGTTVFNSAQRPRFWGGFATSVGAASTICAKMFMRRPDGLTAEQEKDLTAFLEAISPDPSPELDYRALYRTYDSPIRDPLGGDAARGKALADLYCMVCHLEARAAPALQIGLYEPDWIVRRVRHLEGHKDKLMPVFSMARLPDSDLRDIVTWLTSEKPIFTRKSGGK